ncbi:hypothetical protein B0G84_7960 [Paraburkholderia sp. BL8N3]|nr:PqiC family protein [Paraburkholderia sp. BL8N3]TCK33666.1 hypothetical protein B0G84_7960 [Paraburkholderia sp. BL8N3]
MTRRDARSAMTARSVAKFVAAMTTAVLLHGCASSPPTHYVTLNSVPAEAPAREGPVQPVQLTALHIPAELDRPEMVTQSAPNQFAVSETERWAAPLAQLMRLTLARDLQTRLPDGAFVWPDLPAPKGTRALVVAVTDIRLPAQGEMTLDATWTLVARSPDRVEFVQHATLRTAMTGAGPSAKAAAMSRALGELADRIAGSVSAH